MSAEPVVNPEYGSQVLPATQPDSAVGFESDVRPILDAHCALCHSGPSSMGGVDLSLHQAVLTRVQPGQPESSKLYQVLVNKIMPPAGLPPVAPGDIETIGQWITGGAQP